jgi:hypothetical protein
VLFTSAYSHRIKIGVRGNEGRRSEVKEEGWEVWIRINETGWDENEEKGIGK